jgi:hypothetical protein
MEKLKCKSCGIEITKDEYDAFEGDCCNCNIENRDIIETINLQEEGLD